MMTKKKKATFKAKSATSVIAAEEELAVVDSSSSDDEEVDNDDNDRKDLSKKIRDNDTTMIANTNKPSTPNVIYIGHLPKECEEQELAAFLKQFGRVVQLRICRSHRTGGTKGYAFARFQNQEVASIVADALSGHLLFQKRLVSHVLAPEQIHGKLFTLNSVTKKSVLQKKKSRQQQRRQPQPMEKMEEVTLRLVEREQQKRAQLKSMGIDYDFPGYEGLGSDEKKQQQQPPSLETTSSSPDKESASDNGKRKIQPEAKTNKKRKNAVDNTMDDEEIEEKISTTPKKSENEKPKPLSEKTKKKKDKHKKRRKSAP